MEAFTALTAPAVPLLQANVDTDQIIPTRFLTRPPGQSLADGLFAEWRVRADGSPNSDFVLDQPCWQGAQVLVAGANFGCGSSREAAPRVLRQCGFRALIAPSFGDIFFNNCFRNGIVPVRLPDAAVAQIAATLQAAPGTVLTVDLGAQTVSVPATGQTFAFDTPPLLRRMLLQGLDEIALTLTMAEAIAAFRVGDRPHRPLGLPATRGHTMNRALTAAVLALAAPCRDGPRPTSPPAASRWWCRPRPGAVWMAPRACWPRR
jgi:3-isopropylmalate/(R)-2-methylmalate dehydratase small subunit